MYGIFTYIWLICMVNVGKYTSPMDAMGNKILVGGTSGIRTSNGLLMLSLYFHRIHVPGKSFLTFFGDGEKRDSFKGCW